MTGDDGRAVRRLGADERIGWLRLLRSENVGPATFHALIERFGDAETALAALPELSARGGLGRPIRVCGHAEAEAELEAAGRLGLTLIGMTEPEFPRRLAHTEGGPPLLYVAGDISRLDGRMVAIVGARNCSAAGRRLAREIASELADNAIVIVSGLARGIDAAAHEASLHRGTIAVLAGGHGRIYPPEHEDLARRIAADGALVSEMPPGWSPRAKDFPRRNRIISGLSLGVVIIEAAARSGSLITARFALEQGRDVFAVPGSPLDPRAEGANRLIRQGAVLTRSAGDVLEMLANELAEPAPVYRADPQQPPCRAEQPPPRDSVIEALGPDPIDIDELVRQTGASPGFVMQALVELELAGRLERHPGQRVSLM